MKLSRRSVLGGLSAIAAARGLSFFNKIEESYKLPKGLTILFQGDSITDGGRNRGAYYANNGNGMGQGYVRHIVTDMLGRYPDNQLQFYNRGISGHKVFQLRDRWNEDCMMLEPDVLSVLIGVNDFWHTLTHNYQGTADTYKQDFMSLIKNTLAKAPDTKLIIGEPFVMHEGTAIITNKWKGKFELYQEASREVADRFNAVFIPYQQIFDDALKNAPTSYWCPDGVHPSMAGNYLMAKAWMKAFNQMMH